RRGGLDTEMILEILQFVNMTHCKPPLPNKDLKRIARSIGSKPAGEAAQQSINPDDVVDDDSPIPNFYSRAEVIQELERYSLVETTTTGFPLLDKFLGGGLIATQATVLIAPTGSGKTALAMQLARAVSYRRPVVVWTMEMAAPVLAARMATQESGDYYLDVLRDRDLQ